MGFGLLDALAYVSPDEKSRVLVTTDELFGKWLRARKPDVPQNADAAARSAAFYTRALPTDAMIFKYAELPVMKPADAKLAAVLLIARSQDIGPVTPGEIVVSVVRGDRVFVAVAPAQAKVGAIAACDQVWKDLERAAERLLAQYDQTEPKNEKLYDKYTKAQENNDRAYRACFAAHAKGESFFPALVRQAQALVDALPKR